jgi:hypothetical protein
MIVDTGGWMRNITFSADEKLIEAARDRAREQRTTLNEEFRRWLAQYAGKDRRVAEAMTVIRDMQKYVRTGGKRFTREELNER